jgi:radical SAM protein with 4Fe4S-binding SPASM domain
MTDTKTRYHDKKSVAGIVAAMRSDPHAPFSAMIEIADRCNEVCVHCYQVQGQKGEISTDDWKRALDELAELGVLFLTISGGEATLRKDFLEIVEHARKRRFAVKIYTNGLTMTAELAAKLRELAVQEVQISLYSHRPELHDWVTRVPGSWQKTVEGVRALVAERIAVVVKSPLMRFNAADYQSYMDFVASLGADFSLDPVIDAREDGDRDPERLRMDTEQYLAIMRDPTLVPEREEAPPKNLDQSVCGACSGNVHIEANGEMRPCTQLDVPLGNVLTQRIRDAWHENEAAQEIRAFTWEHLPGCRVCDLQPYCARCYASARTEVGDAMAPYPSACRRARLEWELSQGRAPVVEAAEGRDGTVGPYREVEPGRFVPFEAERTPEDEARAARHGWTRRATGPAPDGAAVVPGALVQIRRPGAPRERVERVPASGERAAAPAGAAGASAVSRWD